MAEPEKRETMPGPVERLRQAVFKARQEAVTAWKTPQSEIGMIFLGGTLVVYGIAGGWLMGAVGLWPSKLVFDAAAVGGTGLYTAGVAKMWGERVIRPTLQAIRNFSLKGK